MNRTASAVLAAVALLLGIVAAQGTARAQATQASLDVELSMADGGSYDHSTGGGTWGDGPGGEMGDVWDEQQWPPDFACGDVVSFMLLVTSASITGVDPAPRTVQVDLELDAATSGLPGAGYTEFLGATVLPDDPGNMGDGDSTAAIVASSLHDPHQVGGKLYGTVEITDVEVGDRVITRVDVRATCSGDHSGILYGKLHQQGNGQSGFREMAPQGPRDLGAGQNLVQMVQVTGTFAPATTTTSTTTTAPPDDTTTTTAGPGVDDQGGTTTSTTPSTSTTTPVTATGTLSVTKTADRSSATVGDLVRYTITISNGTDEPLTNVVVRDELVDLEELVGELAPGAGETLTAEYRVTPSDLELGSVTNVVTVTSDELDPVTATARVDVVADQPVTGVSVLPSGPLTLPRTGSDPGQPLLWSAAFVAAGLSLLTAARGRRLLDQLG